ncbi:DUF1801 domain-containing protein [Novosphingobium sp. Gsoil 351]|uniref:DUF1801 domain-containing protein n=1 Tax=Novosphingobium sp. Gsoil 351 TaxID=2675225 RepID=UPI0012B4647D|nr:DUF1801 domain-containing protein [Novosphingobium sp. Gsoil 351]QGN53433.1 hypothetical protein GKE62_01570 [Novosphingobium sp. Gsoil 351]
MSDAEAQLAEVQLDGFIAKFDPANQALIRDVRAALKSRFPTGFELVWDNYNFLVIATCTSERPSDAIVSLAAGANGVGLSFYRGAELDDPAGVLLGEGVQNRFIRLPDASVLARPEVAALIDQAAEKTRIPLPANGTGKLIIRSISAKQRPRRYDQGARR